ncbi:hypothetical protein N1851_028547 [Merluccius polli]|uniref:CCHC-type domain-containing protein n=1 Tax=Merluccius polli TaxID=89951 RepID=A0AA47M8G9_MERPO|nr:hypothetical protein N1851_028547 [Merluccius polli]
MAGEELAAQVRALTELVQKLQSDNEKLREEVNTRPGPSNPDDVVGEPAASVDPAAVPAPTSPLVTGRYVLVPRERKCPKFSGKTAQDPITVEEWVEEARRSLGVRPMSQTEKTLFVFDLLDGEAKAEVKLRPSGERDNPEKIFAILLEAYGCSQTYITLQQQFFQRGQLEGESLREYSHEIMSLMEMVKRKAPLCFPNPDNVLRDQFIEHVKDIMLKRELRRHMRLHPNSSFLDIRREALRWVEEGEHIPKLRSRAYSCNAQRTTECEADLNVISAKPTTEISELKECLVRQQAQLDAIMHRLYSSSLRTHSGSTTHAQPSQHQRAEPSFRRWSGSARGGPFQPRFQQDGTPICLRCNQPGHMVRACLTTLPLSSRALPPAGGTTVTTAHSEN